MYFYLFCNIYLYFEKSRMYFFRKKNIHLQSRIQTVTKSNSNFNFRRLTLYSSADNVDRICDKRKVVTEGTCLLQYIVVNKKKYQKNETLCQRETEREREKSIICSLVKKQKYKYAELLSSVTNIHNIHVIISLNYSNCIT